MNVKIMLCIKSWSHVCSFKRLFVPQNLKSCNLASNHPHYQTNLLVDWNRLLIYCVVLHPIPNTWIVSSGNNFFIKIQGAIPITKHIYILSGMQIAPKCYKFMLGCELLKNVHTTCLVIRFKMHTSQCSQGALINLG